MYLEVYPQVLAVSTIKRCTKCGTEYPATSEYFRRSNTGKHGVTARCKSCLNTEGRSRYAANRTEVAVQQHDYYLRNADARKAYGREYYQKNKDRAKENVATWKKNNPDKSRAIQRKWANKNQDKVRARVDRWRAANPDKRRAQAHRRRALVKLAQGSFSADDIEAIRKAQGNRCYLCGKKLKKYHIDHFIPLVRGGTNDPGNLRLACPHCNQTKNAKHPHELGILI